MDYYPELVIRDLFGPMKTKGRPPIAIQISSDIQTSKGSRRKRSCGYCREQAHISAGCVKRKLGMQSLHDNQDLCISIQL